MFRFILFVVMLFFANCAFDQSPTSPSLVTGTQVLQTWSPYVGIHPYGAGENQKPYLEKLIQAGALKGMRVESLDDPGIQQFARWLDSRGVEVLGLFDNKYLRSPDLNQIFAAHVAANSEVRVWEIGNEVQGFVPMSATEYMSIFKNLHGYVRANNMNVWLAPQSDGLQEMLDNGLEEIVRNDPHVVITVHFYEGKRTIRLEDLEQQIVRLPAYTQVWITETGENIRGNQPAYVVNNYPRYRSALRSIRIFWYVMSECPKNEGDFSLVAGLPSQCAMNPAVESPLYQALVSGGVR